MTPPLTGRATNVQVKKLAVLLLFIGILGPLSLETGAAEVPRNLCAFLDIKNATSARPAAANKAAVPALGDGIRAIQGITFDLRDGGVALRTGEKLVLALTNIIYAGEQGIDRVANHDMGPLVLYSVQEVYLVHRIVGNPPEKRIGAISFEYQDGSTEKEEIVLGENVGSVQVPSQWADNVSDGFCVVKVLNPVPYNDDRFEQGKGHAIKSITIIVSGKDVVYELAAATCKLGRQKVHE